MIFFQNLPKYTCNNKKMTKKIVNRTKKVVIVGDGGVGKTAIAERFVDGEFSEQRNVPTLGVEVKNTHELSIWDTGGQQEFSGLREGYYIGADRVILVFDTSNKRSFQSLPHWMRLIRSVCANVPVLLVANKTDLNQSCVEISEIQGLANYYGLGWFSVSAKTGLNVQNLFQ